MTTLSAALDLKTNLTESVRILSTTTGIDAKLVAATNLYMVPSGKTAIITGMIVRATAATAITIGPTLGIGVAVGEDDIFISTPLIAITDPGKIYTGVPIGISAPVAAGNIIKVGIDTGATGTAETIEIFLLGFLI